VIGGPWSRLVQALDYDDADGAVVAVLELTECGETAEDIQRFLAREQDIRRFQAREQSKGWAGE
jgi:hypothetical protein